jgi:murein DD-endopeptidase MepM/ murein hydrolase activator NlpD
MAAPPVMPGGTNVAGTTPPVGGMTGQSSGGSYNPNPGGSGTGTELAINDIGNFSATTAPFQQTINFSGTGLQSVTGIKWDCLMPNNSVCDGSPYSWTTGNWGSKFAVASDTRATAMPYVLAEGDPSGPYHWKVTLSSAQGSVMKPFTVSYTPAQSSLQIYGFADYNAPSEPFQPTINLTGSGLSAITEIDWECTEPDGRTPCSGSPYRWPRSVWSGKFAVNSDTNATATPILLAQNDPGGLYHWTARFYAGSQQTAVPFLVNYSQAGGSQSGWPLSVTPSQNFGVIWSEDSTKKHTGVDLPSPAGTPIYAVASGKVVLSYDQFDHVRNKDWGYAVVVRESSGEARAYLHLKNAIGLNATVLPGTKVGEIKDDHVHYSVCSNSNYCDRGALPIVYGSDVNYPNDPQFPGPFLQP